VEAGDQIALLHVLSDGQRYLHQSSCTFESGAYEVNLSDFTTGWKISLAKTDAHKHDRILKVTSTQNEATFFHFSLFFLSLSANEE
jgi:hypothetical protein